VHAAPETGEHDAAHDAHDGSTPLEDGVHVASCDALRPGAAVSPAMAAAAVLTPVFVTPRDGGAMRTSTEVPAPTGSPPLYIAHRALLI
jgi:hypothetical protein